MILTAGRDKEELTRVFEYQVDEFQLKPLNADALARKICWLLDVTVSH